MKKSFCFNNIKTIFILFFILNILYFIVFPHEAFAMDPYENMISDEDVHNRLIISRKEDYMSYNGVFTYNTRRDLFESLYPYGIYKHSSIINDSYDGENYFDIPIIMIYGKTENSLSPGIYYGCTARNIDGLLI
jgi:hypothetical protein